MRFLYGCAVPTIAYIYEDVKEMRHAKSREINI